MTVTWSAKLTHNIKRQRHAAHADARAGGEGILDVGPEAIVS